MRPVFKWQERARRFIWGLIWTLFFRPTPPPFHHWRCALLRIFGAKLGRINFIYPSARIWAPWLLETGDLVTIGRGAEIYNPGGVSLGDRTIVSQDAYLCGATHDYQSPQFTFISKRISTEAHVWICAKAIVLPGVHCEEGSVLGAGAVTSKNLDEWTVYAGNPAVAVRPRIRFDAPYGTDGTNAISRETRQPDLRGAQLRRPKNCSSKSGTMPGGVLGKTADNI